MKKIQIKYNEVFNFAERLKYVLDFLNEHPLNTGLFFSVDEMQERVMTIGYGTSEGDISIPVQNVFFNSNDIQTRDWSANKYSTETIDVYSVEQSKSTSQAFIKEHTIGFDLFETLFFHISRYEEVFCKEEEKNQAGWLKEENHFLVRHQLEDQPLVDQLVSVFFETLLGHQINHRTTFDLSHDIDILTRFTPFYKWVKSLGATVFYRRGWRQFFKSIIHYFKMLSGQENDPYDSFEYLFREESIWKNKVVYFMAGGNTKYDNHYSLGSNKLDQIIYAAQQKAYKIGIHPSYNAGFVIDMYRAEKNALQKKLKQPIRLNRQHWLRFDWNITPYIFDKQGIEVDASMGYNRYLGFRCGTGFPYYLYDFKNRRAFSWQEQPMVFMESSAIHQAKRKEVSIKKLMASFLMKNKYNTHISFNFHNSNFDPLLEIGAELIDFYKNELITIIEKD